MKIVRRLNTLKDSSRSHETNKRMMAYTAELKKLKVKQEGPHDKLLQMFVPNLGHTDSNQPTEAKE